MSNIFQFLNRNPACNVSTPKITKYIFSNSIAICSTYATTMGVAFTNGSHVPAISSVAITNYSKLLTTCSRLLTIFSEPFTTCSDKLAKQRRAVAMPRTSITTASEAIPLYCNTSLERTCCPFQVAHFQLTNVFICYCF